jgi:orotidine-5'-phosphate decarboxylase
MVLRPSWLLAGVGVHLEAGESRQAPHRPIRVPPSDHATRSNSHRDEAAAVTVPATVTEPFADRLIRQVRAFGHPLCVGLDPHLELLPQGFRRGSMAAGDLSTARAVEAFCLALLGRVAGKVAAVKPQAACFERLGPSGIAVLARVMDEARRAGLLVVLDAKRSDIGSTAASYASAYLAADAPLRADALTVSPYLGIDSIEPFFSAAHAGGAGVFVLLRTSNPGAVDLQDLVVRERPVYQRLADLLHPLASRLRGPSTEWSGLGVVVGATWPDESRRVRELLPGSLFLVPGYGAQGASAADAVAGFTRGPTGQLEGGLVNASRAICFPAGGGEGRVATWERAVDDALAQAIEELGEAVA